jgi:hypothetical protein
LFVLGEDFLISSDASFYLIIFDILSGNYYSQLPELISPAALTPLSTAGCPTQAFFWLEWDCSEKFSEEKPKMRILKR